MDLILSNDVYVARNSQNFIIGLRKSGHLGMCNIAGKLSLSIAYYSNMSFAIAIWGSVRPDHLQVVWIQLFFFFLIYAFKSHFFLLYTLFLKLTTRFMTRFADRGAAARRFSLNISSNSDATYFDFFTFAFIALSTDSN